ncbi:MAG: pilus assembly protein, partial [Bilophila sp.]
SAPAPAASDPEDLAALLSLPSSGSGNRLHVSYEGSLRGLLDHVASLSGYGWEYDAKTNRVTFTHMQVRTFTLLSAPGTLTYDNEITNKSKKNSSGTIGGGGINQTVSSGDTDSQTAQSSTTKYKFDVWQECEKGVKALLSPKGTVTSNLAAGTITVRDTSDRLRQIAAYVDDINARLSRQVALTVRVWSLELNDASEAGINLQALFQNSDVSVIAGSLAELGSASSAAVSIVDGKLKGSSAAVKAMREWGKASQVTSSGAVLMSNQPLPVLAVKSHAYLAGMSLNTSDYGQTSEVTPGEVISGFSMTVVPHILDRRRVILQYNINLSSLDDMQEIKTDSITVQLPQMSTRSFSQRTTMKMGQTLVLAGFEQESQGGSSSIGLLNGGKKADYGKTLLVITIEVESAEV